MSAFSGKVAVITGGASGIGYATARRLVAEGAQVAIFDRTEPEPIESAPDGEDRVLHAHVDITDRALIDAAVAQVIARWGRIDILVNAAGVGAAGTVLDNDESEWRRVYDINVMGTVRVIQAVLPHLIEAQPAAVVNVGSAVATTGFPNRALYTATKGAIDALTRAMAADHLKDGVRFNSVCPGTTETPWVDRLLSAATDPVHERANLAARQPHGRLVQPEEVAEAIVYLANPLAGSTNGVTLSIDAGISSVYVSR